MKLLCDFDGVFTDQDGEASEVGRRLAELIGDRGVVERLRTEVRADPIRHGWVSKGILACFADEDPYVFHNAVAAALYERGPTAIVERLVASGCPTHEHLARKAFDEGTERYRAANESHVSPEALEAVREVVARGDRVVIVSNSSTARVESLLSGAGRPADGERLAVRGNALKFIVGEEPAQIAPSAAHGERTIRLRRPHYYKILAKERPDVVIGDVLSLDLAMPAALRARDPNYEQMRVILKRQRHTPSWVLRACQAWGIAVSESLEMIARSL